MISSKKDPKRDVTIHTCSGPIMTDTARRKIMAYYKGKPTRNIIWDFSEADVSMNSFAEIQQFAHETKDIVHSREGGKTAFVSPKDIAYGLSRMYQVFAVLEKQAIPIKVFRSLQEAEQWISGEGVEASVGGGDRREAER